MPSNHLILCRPLLLPPSIFLSSRVFSSESALRIRWPKYWSFSFNVRPSSEHPGLIFRMDWWDLLAVQGTLKSLLQHHSSKASVLRRSAFFMVQLSHPYTTTGKTVLPFLIYSQGAESARLSRKLESFEKETYFRFYHLQRGPAVSPECSLVLGDRWGPGGWAQHLSSVAA